MNQFIFLRLKMTLPFYQICFVLSKFLYKVIQSNNLVNKRGEKVKFQVLEPAFLTSFSFSIILGYQQLQTINIF